MIRYTTLFLFLQIAFLTSTAQHTFTHQDSLRGSITPEREWWDLTFYHLAIKVNPSDKTITGTNEVRFTALKDGKVIQIDLQNPMKITEVKYKDAVLKVRDDGNAHFITLPEIVKKGSQTSVLISFGGVPVEAANPPWDGGITWRTDRNGKPFIASSCQGIGASIWWPCKDHEYDEVDSMKISVTVPDSLVAISNGRQYASAGREGWATYHWQVSNPINNYGVSINIGDYVQMHETYGGEKGNLDLDYWVLSYMKDTAEMQFQQVPRMVRAFEHWFGPYPFYEDSYKLVQVPFLGMEHQSAVAYGNGFMNGYRGRDLSLTGWGLKFDYIIIHESGHEWFANNITHLDAADMWVHEGFTSYSECLYLDYYYGKEAAAEYIIGTRPGIRNDRPIIGNYNVNNPGSGDMYYKGANLLHMIRTTVQNDSIWRLTLRGLNREFYHRNVSSKQVEEYISKSVGRDLSHVFDQYLRDVRIPVLEYMLTDRGVRYRWVQCVREFDLPVQAMVDGKMVWLEPQTTWKQLDVEGGVSSFAVSQDYYVATLNLTGDVFKAKESPGEQGE